MRQSSGARRHPQEQSQPQEVAPCKARQRSAIVSARVAAAAVAAVAFAASIYLDASAHAAPAPFASPSPSPAASGQPSTGPFPSPSPFASEQPGTGGYLSVSAAGLSAAGGLVPVPKGSPVPFRSANASGYAAEIAARISPRYIASLRFDEENVHGDDNAITSRLDTSLLYDPHGSLGVGLSYASLQRSTIGAASNGFGAGAVLLPDFARRASPYGAVFVYPSLAVAGGNRGALVTLRAGVVFVPAGAANLFLRLGFVAQNFSAKSFSPTSLSGVELGAGTRF